MTDIIRAPTGTHSPSPYSSLSLNLKRRATSPPTAHARVVSRRRLDRSPDPLTIEEQRALDDLTLKSIRAYRGTVFDPVHTLRAYIRVCDELEGAVSGRSAARRLVDEREELELLLDTTKKFEERDLQLLRMSALLRRKLLEKLPGKDDHPRGRSPPHSRFLSPPLTSSSSSPRPSHPANSGSSAGAGRIPTPLQLSSHPSAPTSTPIINPNTGRPHPRTSHDLAGNQQHPIHAFPPVIKREPTAVPLPLPSVSAPPRRSYNRLPPGQTSFRILPTGVDGEAEPSHHQHHHLPSVARPVEPDSGSGSGSGGAEHASSSHPGGGIIPAHHYNSSPYALKPDLAHSPEQHRPGAPGGGRRSSSPNGSASASASGSGTGGGPPLPQPSPSTWFIPYHAPGPSGPNPMTFDFPKGTIKYDCPWCDKSYTGANARSVWRRHAQEKHNLPTLLRKRSRWDNAGSDASSRPKTLLEKKERNLASKRQWAKDNRLKKKIQEKLALLGEGDPYREMLQLDLDNMSRKHRVWEYEWTKNGEDLPDLPASDAEDDDETDADEDIVEVERPHLPSQPQGHALPPTAAVAFKIPSDPPVSASTSARYPFPGSTSNAARHEHGHGEVREQPRRTPSVSISISGVNPSTGPTAARAPEPHSHAHSHPSYASSSGGDGEASVNDRRGSGSGESVGSMPELVDQGRRGSGSGSVGSMPELVDPAERSALAAYPASGIPRRRTPEEDGRGRYGSGAGPGTDGFVSASQSPMGGSGEPGAGRGSSVDPDEFVTKLETVDGVVRVVKRRRRKPGMQVIKRGTSRCDLCQRRHISECVVGPHKKACFLCAKKKVQCNWSFAEQANGAPGYEFGFTTGGAGGVGRPHTLHTPPSEQSLRDRAAPWASSSALGPADGRPSQLRDGEREREGEEYEYETDEEEVEYVSEVRAGGSSTEVARPASPLASGKIELGHTGKDDDLSEVLARRGGSEASSIVSAENEVVSYTGPARCKGCIQDGLADCVVEHRVCYSCKEKGRPCEWTMSDKFRSPTTSAPVRAQSISTFATATARPAPTPVSVAGTPGSASPTPTSTTPAQSTQDRHSSVVLRQVIQLAEELRTSKVRDEDVLSLMTRILRAKKGFKPGLVEWLEADPTLYKERLLLLIEEMQEKYVNREKGTLGDCMEIQPRRVGSVAAVAGQAAAGPSASGGDGAALTSGNEQLASANGSGVQTAAGADDEVLHE